MTANTSLTPLGWLGIARLGLVQAALGAIVVLTTATLNRVMVVELALPAMLPGALVALHYGVQVLRPRLGYGSDVSGRRTPWIVGGMALLVLGAVGAAAATAWMGSSPAGGIALAVVAFAVIGVGVGASGTSLLALLAKRVEPRRRPAAATIVWLMMIAGIAITATVAGKMLDPFSPARLVAVAGAVAGGAFLLTLLAVWGVEGRVAPSGSGPTAVPEQAGPRVPFREALARVWAEPEARRFAVFVFVSMLAYSAQDLILEPFAGTVFGMTPGQSTALSGVQHGGVFAGMLLVAILGTAIGGPRLGSMRGWAVGGCVASAAALAGLACAGLVGPAFPLRAAVFALGLANGAFAVAAIGSMMGLAGAGQERREGTRMGLWGAAQALAFGLGGFAGTVAVDLARHLMESPASAYATVFAAEAVLFLASAFLASRATRPGGAERAQSAQAPPLAGRDFTPAGLAAR
jgi:BCD family chlorophyll transporter-like MFS transporter